MGALHGIATISSLTALHKVWEREIEQVEDDTKGMQTRSQGGGGSRGSVEPPFRVTGSKYFSHTPHITCGI